MKTGIKKIISKNKKLSYLSQCIKHIGDDGFVNDVLDLRKDPTLMRFETLGDKNKGKNIFIIDMDDYTDIHSGFFAIYHLVLDALIFAERFGLSPVISYSKKFPYAEEEPINGSTNPFEYYFEQPSGISVEEAFKSFNVIKCKSMHIFWTRPENGYLIPDEKISEMVSANKKYIRLNDTMSEYVNSNIKELLKGKKTLGIHIRGTDFKGGYNNHPILASHEEYINMAKTVFDKYGFEQIFLATDEDGIGKKFEKAFGEKVVYYKDVMRASGNVGVLYSTSDRKNHHYKLGVEVLRDMHTLASCDGLIAGLSHVSTCAQISKKSNDEEYEYLNIINKGVYHNDDIAVDFYRNQAQKLHFSEDIEKK